MTTVTQEWDVCRDQYIKAGVGLPLNDHFWEDAVAALFAETDLLEDPSQFDNCVDWVAGLPPKTMQDSWLDMDALDAYQIAMAQQDGTLGKMYLATLRIADMVNKNRGLEPHAVY